MQEISRRTFMTASIAVAATFIGVDSATGASTYKLGKISKFKPGTLLIVTVPGNGQKISVLATKKGYFAFSTSCTHQGFQLRTEGNKLVCDNHGAQFNAKTGMPTSGPATASLTKLRTSVKKGYIYIKL